MSAPREYVSSSEGETKRLAARLVRLLKSGDVVTLDGDLGAGKTTFVSGALRALGLKGRVISPTFNILKCYLKLDPPVYHVDAYRLKKDSPDIGLGDYIGAGGIAFIEWPDAVERYLPEKTLAITIRRLSDTERALSFHDPSGAYRAVLERLGV